jgi:Metal-dependent hydrolases of the beta-lactamase superfamily III
MKLTFLGTAAGECYPALWCECPNCSYAREHKGQNIRLNSCVLVDDDTLLDMGSTCFSAAQRENINLTQVQRLFVTHTHLDHFYPQHLVWRGGAFSMQGPVEITEKLQAIPENPTLVGPRFSPLPMLNIFGHETVRQAMAENPRLPKTDAEMASRCAMCFHPLEKAQTVQDGDVRATAILSHHGHPGGSVFNYIIERGGKTLLYALDTGGYDDDMLDIIKTHQYDCVVMEGTFGLHAIDVDFHMNTRKNLQMLDFFTQNQLWKTTPNLWLSHMGPHWVPPHDRYAPYMAERGVNIAYDGLTITF